jgi:hypothetical protein
VDSGRNDDAQVDSAHRVTYFAHGRPVQGGTVYAHADGEREEPERREGTGGPSRPVESTVYVRPEFGAPLD